MALKATSGAKALRGHFGDDFIVVIFHQYEVFGLKLALNMAAAGLQRTADMLRESVANQVATTFYNR